MTLAPLTRSQAASARRREPRAQTPERLLLAGGAFALTTFFALLYALRGGIAALDRGESVAWSQQIAVSLAVWWTCLPLLPLLGWMVRIAPLGRAHLLRSTAILVGGTLSAAVARHYLLTPVVTWSTGIPDVPASAVARTLTYFTTFLVMVGLLHAVHYYRRLRKREIESSELARSLAEARLSALRTQLQPHFIFNSLNAIAALLHTDPETADRMLTRFAVLLRFVLQAGVSEEHPLREELAVLRQYLDLMQLRFGDRLRVTWDVEATLLEHPVPWMLLQPLVENALEHGLDGGAVAGHLRIEARSEGSRLQLVIEDDGVGLDAPPDESAAAGATESGVGLANTRARVEQLYAGRASLTLHRRTTGGTRVVVQLPLQVSTVEAGTPA